MAGQVNEMWAWEEPREPRGRFRIGNSVPEDHIPVLEELILVGSRSLGPLGINLGSRDEEFATWEIIMEFADRRKEIAIGTMGV